MGRNDSNKQADLDEAIKTAREALDQIFYLPHPPRNAQDIQKSMLVKIASGLRLKLSKGDLVRAFGAEGIDPSPLLEAAQALDPPSALRALAAIDELEIALNDARDRQEVRGPDRKAREQDDDEHEDPEEKAKALLDACPLDVELVSVLEVLLALNPGDGLIALALKRKMKVDVDSTHLQKRLVPRLKAYGVRNEKKRNRGYYILEESKPICVRALKLYLQGK
ncbi:MAG: hypothetical protein V2A76_18200 [Planctomycetota bacterium]